MSRKKSTDLLNRFSRTFLSARGHCIIPCTQVTYGNCLGAAINALHEGIHLLRGTRISHLVLGARSVGVGVEVELELEVEVEKEVEVK